MAACQSFEDLQLDPNRPVQAEPSLLLTAIETNAFSSVSTGAALASRQLIFTNSTSDNQYYGWQRAGFGDYDQLRQVLKLEEEAERTNNDSYRALAIFFRSHYILKLTNTFGDVPFSNAVKGQEGNFLPSYDSQESIFIQVLEDLKMANAMLSSESGQILGDIIFNGDQMKWKRLINSLSLRTLISLSIKENNSSLNIIGKFAEIYNDPNTYPLMRGNEDNGALRYLDIEGNRYPLFNSNDLRTAYYLEKSFVDRLKAKNDPRLFSFANQTANGRDLPENDPNAYEGLGGANPLAENTNQILAGNGSPIDSRYHSDPENQPSLLMGYPELAFTIAEAAHRGWINADASAYYNEGIRASMSFNGISETEITNYLNQSSISFNQAEGLRLILEEKHTSFFLNTGWESFYNQRRTGIPTFSLSTQIINPGGIPKRWMYPQNEIQLNLSNMNEALQRQFNGQDDINGEMWLLRP
ncbi:SusD/RagB family nutrient-binding outer membrane lipoprotein [Belliella sp. DSM 111904]|uniref:SusD/RagB family nutrient-binding outer membrane lipoprotein n=1 Tax=Belliella filtrata TaxID=2923435 RepID=A0ABS9V1M9_9BACT|nr:SusD/RagB family nutrient-binding outer membrane lipoprotein [Belliella filtrata]MCH7410327.1 SusD/RagB family nutrient-binding outer membrane lipoprotein [Belliella filtrata]